jgi:hypothetical protein
MKAMRARLVVAGSVAVAAAGLTLARAQNSAIAVPPPPPIASVPAQPLMPPQVIVPAQPPAAPSATPGYRLVSPQFNPSGGAAGGSSSGGSDSGGPRWNSGGGGAVPILEPAAPPSVSSPRNNSSEYQPPPDAAALPPSAQSSAASMPPAGAQVPPNPWLPRRNAVLGVLNKEDGAVSRLTVQVGNSVVQGKLQITVSACVTRPDAVAPDAAVFLSIKNAQENQSDSNYQAADLANGGQIFRGWLLRSEPGASVVGDMTDMFRLIGCGSS